MDRPPRRLDGRASLAHGFDRRAARYVAMILPTSVIRRFHRDARLFRIYEGTTQIQQLVIARNMLREFDGR